MLSDSATVALGQSTEDIARDFLYDCHASYYEDGDSMVGGSFNQGKFDEDVSALAALISRETAKARVEGEIVMAERCLTAIAQKVMGRRERKHSDVLRGWVKQLEAQLAALQAADGGGNG